MANEDVYGLYEAVGRMTVLFPDNDASQNNRLAEELIRELLAEGLIFLCYEKKWTAGPNKPAEIEPITAEAVEDVLSSEESWRPYGPEHTGVGFEATEKGYDAWRAPNPN